MRTSRANSKAASGRRTPKEEILLPPKRAQDDSARIALSLSAEEAFGFFEEGFALRVRLVVGERGEFFQLLAQLS
jgi:hypothetical protein